MTALAWAQDDRGGAFHNIQNMHPVSVVALAVMVLVLLMVKRRYAIAPFLVTAFFLTMAQRLVIAGLDLPMIRILILIGWLRVVLRQETRGFRFVPLDKVVILWSLSSAVIYILRAQLTGESVVAAITYRSGWLVDNAMGYFLFRLLVRDWEDLRTLIWTALLCVVPTAIAFIIEKVTARNMFAVFGGVREITWLRQGRLRCAGSFSHPILAGCFVAGFLPLFAAWCARRETKAFTTGVIGVVCCIAIVVCTASSTPIGSVFFGLVAISVVYPARAWMSTFRWGALAALVTLHLIREKPVWHLLARIKIIGGSTGYHRYQLIDAFVHRFDEWAAFGINSTAHWGYFLFDVANFYVLQGVRGGLLTFVLFIALLVVAFQTVGRIGTYCAGDRWRYLTSWMLGVCLFQHCMAWVGVCYFHEPQFLLVLLFAIIGSLEMYHRTSGVRGGAGRAHAAGPPAALDDQRA